jgi:hypothetical protein
VSIKPWRVRQSSLICRFNCRSLFGSFINEPSWTIRGSSSMNSLHILAWILIQRGFSHSPFQPNGI